MMFLKEKDRELVWQDFINSKDKVIETLRGDQDFLRYYYNGALRFQKEFPEKIVSYKADILLHFIHC